MLELIRPMGPSTEPRPIFDLLGDAQLNIDLMTRERNSPNFLLPTDLEFSCDGGEGQGSFIFRGDCPTWRLVFCLFSPLTDRFLHLRPGQKSGEEVAHRL